MPEHLILRWQNWGPTASRPRALNQRLLWTEDPESALKFYTKHSLTLYLFSSQFKKRWRDRLKMDRDTHHETPLTGHANPYPYPPCLGDLLVANADRFYPFGVRVPVRYGDRVFQEISMVSVSDFLGAELFHLLYLFLSDQCDPASFVYDYVAAEEADSAIAASSAEELELWDLRFNGGLI